MLYKLKVSLKYKDYASETSQKGLSYLSILLIDDDGKTMFSYFTFFSKQLSCFLAVQCIAS
jgi:hypothetical protein